MLLRPRSSPESASPRSCIMEPSARPRSTTTKQLLCWIIRRISGVVAGKWYWVVRTANQFWLVSSSTASVPSGLAQCSNALLALALAAPAADPPIGSFLVAARLAQPLSSMTEPTPSAKTPRFNDSVFIAIPFRLQVAARAAERMAVAPKVAGSDADPRVSRTPPRRRQGRIEPVCESVEAGSRPCFGPFACQDAPCRGQSALPAVNRGERCQGYVQIEVDQSVPTPWQSIDERLSSLWALRWESAKRPVLPTEKDQASESPSPGRDSGLVGRRTWPA